MKIWEFFPEVARRVKEEHLMVGLRGHHDYVHAYRVGELARQIAEHEWGNEPQLSSLAGLAGLAHNADRILQKKLGIGRKKVPPGTVTALVDEFTAGFVTPEEFQIVVDAVLMHDGKNCKEDSPVLRALRDADRVVNLDADLIIRAAQHYPELPPVVYGSPLMNQPGDYRNPGSVLRDITFSLEWLDPQSPFCMTTKLGWLMGKKREGLLLAFMSALDAQLEEEGVFSLFPK